MLDDFNQPRSEGKNFDPQFPLRNKYVQEFDRMGALEAQDQNTGRISGELELIARTSYRLGHSEQAVVTQAERADKLNRELRDANKLLEEARSEVILYKSRSEDYYEQFEKQRSISIKWHDKFVRLDKKIHPAKYKAAKAKKASKK